MKLALISVTDKTGIVEFAMGLENNGYQIISTGGTFKILKENNVNVLTVESITGAQEILDGRVKTLNPFIHGGILYKRNNNSHQETIEKLGIQSIDLVCVNLYEFEKAVSKGLQEDEIIEEIDIGGPTMIRAAAKNFKDVLIVTDKEDYNKVIEMLENNKISIEYKKYLANKAFLLIAKYDQAISNYFNPENKVLELEYIKDLSYGENPHQKASLFKKNNGRGLMDFNQLNGKKMSFNNYNDVFAAMEILYDFKDETYFAVAIKHGTICSAATGQSALDAYLKSYSNDPVSIFGGIVAFNCKVTSETATELTKIFLEIIVAPEYDDDALEVLKTKKNLRVLKYNNLNYSEKATLKDLDNYVLKQERDLDLIKNMNIVTKVIPNDKESEDMLFGMKIVKNIKSNGIVIVKNKEVLAVCGGQTARIFAIQDAMLNYPGKDFTGAVLASDAFFPFKDSVAMAKDVGISAIVQPGGSKNDQDSIDYCDKHNMSMVLTGIRHFKH
ncbi:MAG: bifunctional phosphoribosylaminoimidazolecarboxamide formyltransferase/IMP cyclohydrolase [Firmicutes bacterium]|nr:bifunctional phosphoribosylaminoimidazolecarboxamide formyltransferase/IMP cyclohydrolase [Bacillota bacterium]